jgi:hypothetical protein
MRLGAALERLEPQALDQFLIGHVDVGEES